ncbi:MAG: hypothetical protein ACK4TR_08985 [Phenylobacterium sp.]|uniref:hypothetical protein n=1 Tax=Phenylobacterium sp. TaxID=1871053 RepID=UPI00391965CA
MNYDPKWTKPRLVIEHLKVLGRITAATAHQAYGYFWLPGAIFELRTRNRHLVPEGKKIITVERTDVRGNVFAEYRLVPQEQANAA